LADIVEIVDRIEELANSGRKLPMSKKALVDPGQLMKLVDQLRTAIPQDFSRAQEVLRKREDLLSQGLDEARRIRASAETELRSRVDDTNVLKEAQKRSDQTVADAQQKANRILEVAETEGKRRTEAADQYSQEVLYQLEQDVASVLTTIRHGIEVLDARQGARAVRRA
jgi:cell division septum initiation protein DivIVA